MLYHGIGSTQGGVRIFALMQACIFPDWFNMICYVFGIAYFVTNEAHIAAAIANIREA